MTSVTINNEETQSNYSDKTVIYDERPKVNRRITRKKLAYLEPLAEPGTIYNAEVHQSAQRLLKVHRITKYVKFCKCCSLPQETPGVVVPFNFCDKQLDFGLGIYLYFYYIKFLFIMSLLCICLSTISTIVFSEKYSSDIIEYCNKTINNNTNTNISNSTLINDNKNNNKSSYNYKELIEHCYKYIDIDSDTINAYNADVSKVVKNDWMTKMSTYNLKYYYNVFQYQANGKEDVIDSVILDFSFMYFLTGLTVLISNYIFILHINLLDLCENFKVTTPSDYALLIHGVPRPENNGKMKDELMKIVNDVNKYVGKLEVYQIIPCLRIVEMYDVAKKKYSIKKKIYHLNNFEKQKKLNKEINRDKKEKELYYFKDFILINQKIPYQELEQDLQKYRDELDIMQKDINDNPNKYNGGTFFIVFEQMTMRDDFYDFFPHTFATKVLWSIRYFFECVLFQKCMNEEKRKMTSLKMAIDVTTAAEPYEVEWENMGYSRCERNIRFIISFGASIGLIVIAFGIIVLVNYGQQKLSEKQKDFWKYVLSLSVSIVIAITNAVGKLVLKKLTLMEKIEVKTNYYISFSLKHTIFTFVTIAIIPVVSNFVNGKEWGDSEVLVNNLLMIFIMNIFFPPVLFYFGVDLALKTYKRTKARLELEDVKYEKSIYTQGELNEMFENPEMDICSKYSFISNAVLIPLFYMSIFPIGMIFGFAGLLFTYISEFFYVGLYKRPEILNSKLCIFYVSNFKWAIFVFALGNYIFLSPLNKNQRLNWSLINLIIFFILGLIPYQSIKIDTVGISESESKRDTYKDSYIFFSTDYEKLCPFTRKKAYIKYFKKLITDQIIDKHEGKRIIDDLEETNEMAAYIKTKRHLDNYCASQQLNNLYMKNKIAPKLKYLFGDEKKEDSDKALTLSKIKNFILTDSTPNNENIDYDSIRQMKDLLYSFSTTTCGISNALIFLDERKEVINNLDYYNFNPWKADWIYSKYYKNKRKELIHRIRKTMDYKGEVSDDEDSIIKYDETQDDLSEHIVQYNKNSIKNEEKPNIVNDDKPMIFNEEIATGKINSEEKSEEISNITETTIKKDTKSEIVKPTIRPIALNNQFIDNRLYYYNILQRNRDIIAKNTALNYTSIFGCSQSNLLGDNNLFPQQNQYNYKANFYKPKKK